MGKPTTKVKGVRYDGTTANSPESGESIRNIIDIQVYRFLGYYCV
jgi:hypothetical protein